MEEFLARANADVTGGCGGREALHERVPGVLVHHDEVVAAPSVEEVQSHRLHGPGGRGFGAPMM